MLYEQKEKKGKYFSPFFFSIQKGVKILIVIFTFLLCFFDSFSYRLAS